MASRDADEWEDVPASDSEWEDVDPAPVQNENPEHPGVLRQVYNTVRDWDGSRFVKGMQQDVFPGEDIPIVGPAVRSMVRTGQAAMGANSFEDFGHRAAQLRDADERREQEFGAKYPEASLTRGAASGLLLPGQGKLAGMVESQGAMGVVGRYGANVAENAGIGATDTMLRGGDPIRAAKDAAQFGAVMHGAPTALNLAGRGYSRFVAGIPEETRQKYINGRERINSLKQKSVVDELAADIETVKDSIDQRQQTVKQKTNDYRTNAQDDFRMQKSQAVSAADQRKAEIRQWMEQKRGADQTQADGLRREAADQAYDGFVKGKEKIQKGSKFASQQIPDDLEIGLPPYKGALTRAMNKGRINDAPAEGPGYGKIEDYRSFLAKMGEFVDGEKGPEWVPHKTISGGDIKRMIQKIDRDLEGYYAQPNGFADPGAKALARMRQGLDRSLKRQSPEYRDAMAPVAQQSRSRANFQDQFGDSSDSIYRRMNKLDDVGYKDRSKTLQDFDQAFGGKASQTLNQSRAATDKNYGGMQRFLEEGTQGNAQFEIDQAKKKYGARQSNAENYKNTQMEKINAEKKKFAGLGDDGAQAKLKRIGGDPEENIMTRRKIENIAKASGKEADYYSKAADDLAVRRAMTGSFTRGSRNVNMMSKSLHGLVKVLSGSDSAATGAGSIGAIIGGVSDIVGPKLVKWTIDQGATLPQGIKNALSEAAKRGPQAYIMTHEMLLRRDPAYKQAYDYWEKQEN